MALLTVRRTHKAALGVRRAVGEVYLLDLSGLCFRTIIQGCDNFAQKVSVISLYSAGISSSESSVCRILKSADGGVESALHRLHFVVLPQPILHLLIEDAVIQSPSSYQANARSGQELSFLHQIKQSLKYLIINWMSKKVQVKEAPKPVIDQQNEPFLRALQKKVRNINKKLTEITELEAKESLKPEQVEKIARKDALIEERARIEETATLFRETYAENIAVYRAAQLKELETIARAVALHHAGAKLPEAARLTALWEALKGDSKAESLNAAINSLSNTLKSFADDKKLQKSLTTFVEAHGNDKIEHTAAKEEKVEVVSEVKSEPAKEAEPVAVIETEAKPVSEVKSEQKVEEVQHSATEAVSNVEVKAESVPAEQSAKPAESVTAEVKAEESPKEGNDRRGGNRDNRGGERRGQGRPRGDYRRRDNEEPRERRQYKPKNEEREREPEAKEESGSSDSEPETREFRREEIRKLQEEGFVVVGGNKPKPKPKDPKELRSFHDRQHGNKYHHHGKASNS